MKCGDPVYRRANHWRLQSIRSDADREAARQLGLSETFLDTHGAYYITVPGQPDNFDILDKNAQKTIAEQIQDLINQRFRFVR